MINNKKDEYDKVIESFKNIKEDLQKCYKYILKLPDFTPISLKQNILWSDKEKLKQMID